MQQQRDRVRRTLLVINLDFDLPGRWWCVVCDCMHVEVPSSYLIFFYHHEYCVCLYVQVIVHKRLLKKPTQEEVDSLVSARNLVSGASACHSQVVCVALQWFVDCRMDMLAVQRCFFCDCITCFPLCKVYCCFQGHNFYVLVFQTSATKTRKLFYWTSGSNLT